MEGSSNVADLISRDAPRITHLVLSLDVGGLERLVLDLIVEGRKLGQEVSVLCLERPGALAETAQSLGAVVRCADKRPGRRPGIVGVLRDHLRELRPDVVHTHQIGALLYGGPAAATLRVPVVVHTEHGKHYAQRWQTRMLGWVAGHFAMRFFCVSSDIAQEVEISRIVAANKLQVVPNGIETGRFATSGDGRLVRSEWNIPLDAPVIGTVGRLTPIKAQDVLVRAFVQLRNRHPEARLLIVGDGSRRSELERLCQFHGIESHTHFAGYQEHPERFLQAMDVFALTSQSEGMPLAVLEAWAAALPVVAGDIPALADLIDDGKTGLLFSRNDEASLADRLDQALRDTTLARQMGEAGRELVMQKFDRSAMASAYQRHYTELLDRARSQGRCESC